jgi:hypothetical protein
MVKLRAQNYKAPTISCIYVHNSTDPVGAVNVGKSKKKYDDVLFSTAVSQRMKNCPITLG